MVDTNFSSYANNNYNELLFECKSLLILKNKCSLCMQISETADINKYYNKLILNICLSLLIY